MTYDDWKTESPEEERDQRIHLNAALVLISSWMRQITFGTVTTNLNQ